MIINREKVKELAAKKGVSMRSIGKAKNNPTWVYVVFKRANPTINTIKELADFVGAEDYKDILL